MTIRVRPYERVFQPGAVIIAEGSAALDLYIIKSGRVMVAKRTEDGVQTVIEVLGPGELVGELALVDHQVRSASVEAVELTTCIRIPGELVRRQLAGADPLISVLLRVLALRLRLASVRLAGIAHGECATSAGGDPETAQHLARHLRELETCALALGGGPRRD